MNQLKTFNEFLNEAEGKPENYMFFENLKTIKGAIESLLAMDPSQVDAILKDGHDWADDHVSVAKENIDQVSDFFKNKIK